MKSRFPLAAVLGFTLLGGVIASSLTLLASLQSAVVPAFAEIETKAVYKDLLRVENAFKRELDRIDSILIGYSQWTLTYDFVTSGKGENYLEENFNPSYLKTIKLDFVLLLDDAGRLLFDLEDQGRGALAEGRKVPAQEQEKKPFPRPWSGPSNGLLLVVSHPVTNDAATAPPRGRIAFGRFLDFETVGQFCSDLKVDFLLGPVSEKVSGKPEASDSVHISRGDQSITATKILFDSGKTPIAALIVRGERDITQQGEKALFEFTAVEVLAMILSFLLLFVLLRKTVIVPLTAMTARAAELAAGGKGSFRLASKGLAEIAVFTTAFNTLLDELNQARNDLERRVVLRTEELRKAVEELRLMERVVENSPEGIVIADENGVILRVNPAFTSITGFRPDEVVGKVPEMLKSKRHNEEFYAGLRRSLMSKGLWAGEIWSQGSDGLSYPEWLSIVAVSSADNEKSYYIALFHDISDSKKREELIRYQAFHDSLTGLPNRVLLLDELEKALLRSQRRQKKLVVLFMDLDRFKAVNDTRGHETGDLVLKETARRFRVTCRESDLVARHGGDEFVIVMEDVDSIDQVISFAKRLIDTIGTPYEIEGREFHLGLSIGGALFPDDGISPEGLLHNADLALYKAKAAGRNCLRLYLPELNDAMLKRIGLEKSLRSCLDGDLLDMALKPIRLVESSEILGYEAIACWRNEDKLEPLGREMMKVAQEGNLSYRLDFAIMEKTFKATAPVLAETPSLFLSLDVSEQTLGRKVFTTISFGFSRNTAFPLFGWCSRWGKKASSRRASKSRTT